MFIETAWQHARSVALQNMTKWDNGTANKREVPQMMHGMCTGKGLGAGNNGKKARASRIRTAIQRFLVFYARFNLQPLIPFMDWF